jgi:hypothetical protein
VHRIPRCYSLKRFHFCSGNRQFEWKGAKPFIGYHVFGAEIAPIKEPSTDDALGSELAVGAHFRKPGGIFPPDFDESQCPFPVHGPDNR